MLPAFAEEMNRTRSFASRIAWQLAGSGFCVLQPDLSGAGDSTGEFSNATWDNWVSELYRASRWLAEQSEPLNVVTVRAGSLFLPGLVKREPALFEKICMVEPFISGQECAAEFLQLRVARSMFEGTKESIAWLTGELNKGVTLEIAGYELSPDLHRSLCLCSIEQLDAAMSGSGFVVGCGRSEDNKRNTKIKALVDKWKAGGLSVDYKYVGTDPFWSQELPTVPQEAIQEIVNYLVGPA